MQRFAALIAVGFGVLIAAQDASAYYHAQLGRFVNRDPIEYAAGNNMYRYTGNNPVVSRDPLGLATVTDDAGATCCPDEMATVELRVETPALSITQQVLEDIRSDCHGKSGWEYWQCILASTGSTLVKPEVIPGHANIVVGTPWSDELQGYGLYPGADIPPGGGFIGVPGIIKPDDQDAAFDRVRYFRACPETFRRLMSIVSDDIANDGLQYQYIGSQCTTWACRVMQQTGFAQDFFLEPYSLGQSPGFEDAPPIESDFELPEIEIGPPVEAP